MIQAWRVPYVIFSTLKFSTKIVSDRCPWYHVVGIRKKIRQILWAGQVLWNIPPESRYQQ